MVYGVTGHGLWGKQSSNGHGLWGRVMVYGANMLFDLINLLQAYVFRRYSTSSEPRRVRERSAFVGGKVSIHGDDKGQGLWGSLQAPTNPDLWTCPIFRCERTLSMKTASVRAVRLYRKHSFARKKRESVCETPKSGLVGWCHDS